MKSIVTYAIPFDVSQHQALSNFRVKRIQMHGGMDVWGILGVCFFCAALVTVSVSFTATGRNAKMQKAAGQLGILV